MSHKTRVERHIIVDLIAATAAGSLVAALTTRSWVAALLAVASGIALLLLERSNIQEEDQLESNPDFFPEVITQQVPVPQLLDKDLAILRKKTAHPPSDNIPTENLGYYMAGLEDGAAEMAKWVLNQVENSE